MIRSKKKLLLRSLLAFALVAPVLAEDKAPTQNPAADPAATPKHRLRQIIIAETVEIAQQASAPPGGGFVMVTPALASLDIRELGKRLAETENQIVDSRLLGTVAQAIEGFARQQKFPHATTIVPTQNIASGVLRIALLLNPPLIRRIVIGAGVEDAQQMTPAPDKGFVQLSPALSKLKTDELAKRLAPGENQPFQEKLVAAIAQVIEVFLKQSDFPAASAVIPPQNASDGTLRVAVNFGRIRNIKMEGNRWFSESLLREKLRVEQGETIRLSELDRAISWTNNNPFRRVRVRIDPVANTGEADLIIAVQESVPLRFQASYDNGGNALVGRHRMTAAATYANLWGRDHQVSYQLITTDLGPNTYLGQGFDYRVPLPWRDSVQASASYVKLQPSLIDGLLTQEGESINASLRYTHPLRTGDSPAEIYAGFEFKQSNNNLLFWTGENSSVPVVTNKTDILQFTAGASMLRRDKRGAWAFGANVNLSPGRLNSRNSDAAFDSSRPFSKSRYAYGQLTFQRLLTLERGWDFTSRGVLQVAHSNLLPSEQLFIGGATTVRGFRENVFGGDSGFLLTNELLAPVLRRKLPLLPKARNAFETRFLGFYDVANVRLKERTNLDPKFVPLASAGFGLRMSVATHLTVIADYGWQLTYLPYVNPDRSRGHIKATLAF